MLKFKTLLFRALPNGAHYSFFEKVNRELADAGADVKAALASLLPEFNKWFAMEYADLEWYRK
ncbi:MAG: hypothetical protein LBE71_03930, partial [Dysgonamonadaceae bacterium]|nr:hypothetical protein [Dysgonamonadaceae bacterium]